MRPKTVALPFFYYPAASKEALGREAELAALLGLSEAGRGRKGFLSGEEERLKYVAPFSYPVYACPWHGMALLVKPFRSSGTDLKQGVTTDFHEFLGEMRRTSIDRGEYGRFLAAHVSLFAKFPKTQAIHLGEFIPDGPLASLVVAEAKAQPMVDEAAGEVLPYLVDAAEAERRAARFEELWGSIRIDLDNLSAVSSILKEELERQIGKMEIELSLIEDAAEEEIEVVTPSIRKALTNLERMRNSEIRRLEREHKTELSALSRADGKLETEMRRRRQQEARFEREKERRKRRGDKHGERFWDKELKGCQREISRLETRLRRNGEKADRLKSSLAEALEGVRKSYAEKIGVEQRPIREIERRRDQIIRELKEAMIRMEEHTGKITEDLARQAGLKRLEVERLEDFVVPWKIKTPITVSIPFYLARYSSRSDARYDVIPPVRIETDRSGLTQVTRRLVGLEGKLTDLLKPFDQTLSDLIAGDVSPLFSSDAAFASKADDEAARLNLLSTTDLPRIIEDGFGELVEAGLLSRGEASKIRGQTMHWGGV